MDTKEAGKDNLRKSFPLEPMTLGEIIDNTLHVFRHNWKDYLIAASIYAVPMMVLFLISLALGFSGKKFTDPEVMIFNLLSSGLGWVFYLFLSVIIIRITQGVVEGKPCNLKESFLFLCKNFIPYALTILLNGAAIIGLLLVMALLAVPVFFALKGSGILGLLLFVLYVLVIFTGFMYLMSMLLLVSNAALIEGNYYGGAIMRSIRLFNTSWDARWKIMTLPGLTQFLVVILTAFIPIIGYFFMMLLTPIPLIALTMVYYDVRIRTEGLDMEIEVDRLLDSQTALASQL